MSAIAQILMGAKAPKATVNWKYSRRTGANIGTTTITQSLNVGPSDVPIGTPQPGRRVVIALQGGTGTATGISACTITPLTYSAIAMTNLINIGTSGDGFISIWIATVPDGTDATFSATVSGASNYSGFHVFEVQGLISSTPVDTYSDNAGGANATLTSTLDVAEDGVIISIYNAYNSSASNNVAWSGTSGIVEVFDDASAGAGIVATSACADTSAAIVNSTAICNPGTTSGSEKIASVSLR
jgi:hypothetical protein